ncbi:uncharacterized protein [Hyperolius riggenbachi]|uniref:uncharacterized protein n=1 Tax=Hyperolius riggenbachi TaxID=752182 RepID=UPI0035A38144
MMLKIVMLVYMYLHHSAIANVTEKFPHVNFANAGEMASITCDVGTKFISSLQWYKEREDGGLQEVSRRCYPESSSTSKFVHNCNNPIMKIKSVESSDAGVYYCSDSGLDQKFYAANTLIVTENIAKDPTLSILASVAEYNPQPDTTVLLCIALNWSDKWSLIKWHINGNVTEGWLTVDPDGCLRSLIFLPKSLTNQGAEIICSIKSLNNGRNISTPLSGPRTDASDASDDQKQCYYVIYAGLGFAVLLLVVHQIIFAKLRQKSSTEVPKKPSRTERAVRFSPEDEMVTYAPVKG